MQKTALAATHDAALARAGNEEARAWGKAAITILDAAEISGLCSTMYLDAVEYARTRIQFGRPISEFQVLRHRLVDMHLAVKKISALMAMAAPKLVEVGPGSTEFASHMGRTAREAAKIVGEGAIQIHGAMGLSDELRLARYFRRAMGLSHNLPNWVTAAQKRFAGGRE